MPVFVDNTRLFKPGANKDPHSLVKHYPASGLTFLKLAAKFTTSTTIIAGVDGACRDNGKLSARSSWGIYFGRNSPYNTCGRIPKTERQTNNVAEIYAAKSAVKLVSQRVLFGPRDVTEVVIMSDSAWLVNSMTDWIFTWKKNGFKNSRHETVVNSELIRELDDLIEDVEATLGLRVRFWHVKRKRNSGADRLANIALDVDADWEIFWRNQLADEPRSALTHLLAFQASALEVMGPRLLCLEYPLTGTGEWNSSLRTFLILQAMSKVRCLPSRSQGSRDHLLGELLSAILGPNWRWRANRELEKNRGKVDAQTSLLNAAMKRFYESGDERKRKVAVVAEVNNHVIMTLVSRSLEVSFPLAGQNENYSNLIKTHLSDDPHWNGSNKLLTSIFVNEVEKETIVGKVRRTSYPNALSCGVRLTYPPSLQDNDWDIVSSISHTSRSSD